jgi:ubiquinol-cytochrome c reductase iron-sulfur subunit
MAPNSDQQHPDLQHATPKAHENENSRADGGCTSCNRRRWLIATSVVGGLGGIAAAVPFVASLAPSEKTKEAGAAVEVDISALTPGNMMTVAWRGLPVWILNRTDAMLASLQKPSANLADPQSDDPYSMPLPPYCRNSYRARVEHPAIFVAIGLCTHLGCMPVPRFQAGAQPGLPDNWPGGFLCPCHGSMFDLAGRVFKNQPAPQNLDVPRYQFRSPVKIVIGSDEHGAA